MSVSIVAGECPPGTMVWVPAASKDSFILYQQGKVLAVDDATCTVRTADRVVQINLLTTTPLLVNEETMAPDMTSLHHIHEPAILSNLKNRSLVNSPYSFMSSVLIAVNPLRPIPEPFPAGAFPGGGIPPHPYSVAEIAYQQMMFKNSQVNNQSIVIAGESGAGKTESAKMVLAHLVAKTSKNNALQNLDKRLLGTSPILESFGNSTTLRNPNSSRFGKMMRLHFENSAAAASNGGLLGATVQSYLLERSRVTSHEQGERNFHVFYQLLAAANNNEQHSHLQLTELGESFRYVKPGRISSERDLVDYNLLVQSLQEIGVVDAKPVFEILAGLLHLGEITFVDDDSSNEGNAASVNSPQALQTASTLLGLDPFECSKVFCERKLVVQNKTVVSKRSARAAGFARDAAAKAIYSCLFDWLVRRINENVGGNLSSATATCSLGVLDIFGFESFKVNQFEQLLINYCNEALQGTFNAQIFVAEASLYEKEGLFGANELLSRPSDNGICVEFLQSKSGLLAVIDSEGKSPDCSDAKMLQRIHTAFNNHPVLVKPHPKDAAKTFIVRHYCSQVVYTVGSFLEKNNDRLPDDLELFLASSQKQEVRELFPLTTAPIKSAGSRAPPPARSISAKFTGQIRTLVDDLESTKCSFIRCVKPNPAMVRVDGDDTWFDERYVQMQLNALNVPQTCEVLRNGFPTRLDYSVLVDLYWKVLPPAVLARYSNRDGSDTNHHQQHKAFCRALFFAFQIPTESYKLGNTKVFFKSGQLAQLDSVLKSASEGQLGDEVLLRFRLCYIRTKWRRILLAAQALEIFNSMFVIARKETLAATAIQSFVRRNQARRKYLRLQRGAKEAQRLWRGRKGRELASEVRKEKIREAKKLAELEERTKREREEAAAAAKALEEQEERQRKEALEQAKAVEEALAKQEMEAKAQEEKDQVKRRQSIKIPRKSVVALKASKRSDISVSSRRSDLNPDMLTLRSKTLATSKKSYIGGGSSPQRAVSGEQDELNKRRQSAKQLQAAAAAVPKERQGSISAKIRQIRRSKTGSRASIMPAAAAVGSSLVPPMKSPKPSNLAEQKSSMEKMATLARENFSIKVRGQVLVLDTKMLTETVEVTPVYDEDEEEEDAPSNGGGLFSKLKRRLLGSTSNGKPPITAAAVPAVRLTTTSSVSKKWVQLSYLLDKPARKLLLFNEGAEKAELQVELTASLKVRTVAVAKQQHAIELKASHKPAVYVAFETLEEKRVWERDVREAIIGYRAPVHLASDRATKYSTVENDERMADLYTLYSAQMRQERLAQLVKLYKEGEITKEEFDKTCEIIANTPDPGAEDENFREYGYTLDGYDDAQQQGEDDFGSQVQCPNCSWTNNTLFGRFNCVKCGQALKGAAANGEEAATHDVVLDQLKSPFATGMPFEDGRVSGELVGKETSMDFSTYQEISLFGIDMRFRDEELLDLQVGWLVSHRLDKFAALHAALVDSDGPLTSQARKRIPQFPANLREDSPTAAQELNLWLTQLFALVPQGGKQTDLVYHDDEAAANNAAAEEEDDAAAHERFTAEWRSVKDVETGDVYYFNKVTGETTWVNPFNIRAMRDLKTKLPLNWEAVVDKETSDVYYWNTVTLETTWEKPSHYHSVAATAASKGNKKRKLLEAKDLLHVAVVNRFLDLKRNTQRMDDLANNY